MGEGWEGGNFDINLNYLEIIVDYILTNNLFLYSQKHIYHIAAQMPILVIISTVLSPPRENSKLLKGATILRIR
jgi:hypothetical protein